MRVKRWKIANVAKLTILRRELLMPMQQSNPGRTYKNNDQNRDAIRLPSRPTPAGHTEKIIFRGDRLSKQIIPANHSIHSKTDCLADPISKQPQYYRPMTARWQRIARILGIATFAVLLLCTLTPLPNLLGKYQSVASSFESADAIVVLGAGMLIDHSLTNESMRRLIRGMSLYKEGRAPLMVVLGPVQRARPGPSEARTRAGTAIEFGIPKEAVITIETALTTHAEALLTADALRVRRVGKVLLVTESTHMRRAKLLFEKVGFTVLPVSSDNLFEIAISPQERLRLVLRLAQETVGIAYYRIAGYI
jgi:uncharacterized SAM-binding protein YcdF (DUF218 family)